MIIACPACATRYAVPESAIGPGGRTVRCAKCRHSWFQEGPGEAEMALAPMVPTPAPMPAPVPQPTAPQPPVAAPVVAPPIAEPPVATAFAAPETAAPVAPLPPPPETPPLPAPETATAAAPAVEPDYSSFAHEPPFRPRRNRARVRTLAAGAFALAALGVIAAVVHFGTPEWLPLAPSSFGAAPPDLKLGFTPTRQERRTLPNGLQFFGVNGTVVNTGAQRRDVPDLLIVLRDSHNQEVYKWTVRPPRHVLAPGESELIVEAVTDIPPSAKFAEIGWKPD